MLKLKTLSVACSLLLGSGVAMGITLEEYLHKVETGNPLLKSSAINVEALSEELSSENRLEPLEVEYSPFFRKGAGGVANSELIIQQGFDFPTVYGARRKASLAKVETAGKEGFVNRRDLLVTARRAYIDLVFAMNLKELCSERLDASIRILELVKKQKEIGAVPELDVNRAEMEVMTSRASFNKSEGNVAAAKSILESLMAENEEVGEVSYPKLPQFRQNDPELVDMLLSNDPELAKGKSELAEEEAAVNVARQSILPHLSVGYRRNKEERESVNGFLVGASLPLYGGGAAVKSARRRVEAKALENETLRMRLEGEIAGKNNQCVFLQKALEAYDLKLLKESLELMRKGVEMRHIPLQDYYVQAAGVYDKMTEYLELENELQNLATELLANTL